MNKLPDYINCQNKEIVVCDYYMHKTLCLETCAYAKDINRPKINAMGGSRYGQRVRDRIFKNITTRRRSRLCRSPFRMKGGEWR